MVKRKLKINLIMVPIDKVKDIINKHNSLEKELSAGNIDPKLFAKNQKNIQILAASLI